MAVSDVFDLFFSVCTLVLMIIIIFLNIFVYKWLYKFEPDAVYWIDEVKYYTKEYDQDKKLFKLGELPFQKKIDNIIIQYNKDKEYIINTIDNIESEYKSNTLIIQENIDKNFYELQTQIAKIGKVIEYELSSEIVLLNQNINTMTLMLKSIQKTVDTIDTNTEP